MLRSKTVLIKKVGQKMEKLDIDLVARSAKPEVLADDFRRLAEFLTTAPREILALYDRLHKRFFAFVFLSLAIISAGWFLNIQGYKSIIVVAIPGLIAINAYLFFKPNNSLPVIVGIVAYELVAENQTGLAGIRKAVEGYLLLVSSVIYAAVWPLILLTWVSFEPNPKGFWVIFIGLILIILTGQVFGSSDDIISKWTKKLRNYILIAGPMKLLHQFLFGLLKVALLFS